MIKVVDGLCGSGKSTRMLDIINSRTGDVRWIFITPYLTEVEQRVPESTPNIKWYAPSNKGSGKLGDLNIALRKRKDIVSTHALFKMFTKETVELIIDGGYTLVIDEAIDCIGKVGKGVCNSSDTAALLEGGFISIETNNSILWNEERYPEHLGRYADIRNMCNLGILQSFRDTFIMWQYPDILLSRVKECYVLTYMFEGSTMSSWLRLKGIEYSYVDHSEFGLRPEEDIKTIVRANLLLVDSPTIRRLHKNQTIHTFSSSWYNNAPSSKIKIVKGMIRSAVVSNKLKQGDIFWTCFKSAYEKMKGTGYTKGASDKGLAFLPWNIRATNDFREHKFCVYGVNLFKDPTEVAYMESLGVSVESEDWALSHCIQFIFRGAIREGNPMKLMILSKRMQSLLVKWLYN